MSARSWSTRGSNGLGSSDPGDVINNGTSGGTAAGVANQRNQEVRYLQPGQVISATIDGIGTLTMPTVGEPEPQGLTGAQLPAVRTYRGNRR